MIGSFVEGTRIWKLDEADCFLLFKKLKAEHFQLVNNSSTQYKLTTEGKKLIHPDFVQWDNNLDYFRLLEELLKTLEQFLRRAELPPGMYVSFKKCTHKVNGDGNFDHLKHCSKCLLAVTFTKAGPCASLWDGDVLFSIDLIPLFCCPESNPMRMFGRVTGSLFSGDLTDWLPYTKKYVKSDCVFPEAMTSQSKEAFTSLKLLHARNNKHMFILRPRQSLAMTNLQDPKLKRTYCFLKALKSLMNVDLSSFSIKRVLLLEDFTQQAQTAHDSIHLLFLAISYPHLKPYFIGKIFEWERETWKGRIKMRGQIDFARWSEVMEDNKPFTGVRSCEYNWIPLMEL